MRIAVIGAGIAGHGAALALIGAGHDVIVYERDARTGGHSATVDVDWDGVPMAVDTGFIVYNELNYQNFTTMLRWLGVATQPSDMSFAVSINDGRLEWCGRDTNTLSGLFAQRRNIVSLPHLAMLREVLRFQQVAAAEHRAGASDETLGDFLDRHRFSRRLRDGYVIPMGAAIWSMSPNDMLTFPLRSFLAFFDNHRLLQWERPQWRTVAGGSRNYVSAIAHVLGERLRLSTPVTTVRRRTQGVEVVDASGAVDRFDHVVCATHAPQALEMLAEPSPAERTILGACRTATNDVWLHRDVRLMPRRRRAWAAWNVMRRGTDDTRAVSVSYWMNLLQSLDRTRPVFVSLNPLDEPARGTVFGRFKAAHPQFDEAAAVAQAALPSIQDIDRVSFCGAWTAHGFHEDGLASGLLVAARLGAAAPWTLPQWREAAQ